MCNKNRRHNNNTKFRTVKVIKCGKTFNVFINVPKQNNNKKIDYFNCFKAKILQKRFNNKFKKHTTNLNLLKSVVDDSNWFLFRAHDCEEVFNLSLR